MKLKKVFPLLVLVLALALVSCQGEKADPSGSDSTQPSASTPDLSTFSNGLDEEGHFAGVRALDYVTPPAFEDVKMPEFPKISSDRAIADGDFVNIDYVGSIDGVEFDGGSTQGKGSDIVVGKTSFIDDFIEQLKGHKPGENFDIVVTFPEDYGQESLNGKDAVFNITVNYIWDVTDEAAKAIGFVGRDEMGQYVAYNYASVEQLISGEGVELNVFAAAAQGDEIPDAVMSKVRELISASVQAEVSQYAAYGFDLDTYLSYFYGVSSMDELLDAQAGPTARMYLILQAVAERDGITVTQEDITASGYDQYVEIYGKPYVAYTLLQEKVREHIAEEI